MLTFTKAVALLSRPHLITPEAAAQYVPRLMEFDRRVAGHSQPLELVARLAHARPHAMDDDDDRGPKNPTRPLTYSPRYVGEPDAVGETGWTLKNGVGLMCIDSPLVERGFGICGTWMHGYDSIEAAVREMDADDRVKGIFIKWDCPGGVVAPGLYDLTAYLQKRKADANAKPMWSYADVMCSGAYWLGSQSPRLICHEAAFVGSIGAVYTHYSLAGMYDKAGLVVTPIQFGAHKTDGADYKLLDDAARAEMQADIDQIGEDFLATVEVGRGDRFIAEQARATQARVFPGRSNDKSRDALALGLVDAVMPEQEAFAALLDAVKPSALIPAVSAGSPAARAAQPKPAAVAGATLETDMKLRAAIKAALDKPGAKTSDDKLDEIRKILDEEDDPAAEGEEEEPAAEGEEEEPAAEDADEEDTSARRAGGKPAASVDPKVAQAILALPEAEGREKLAQRLAFKPGMTLAEAKADLAAAPKASRLAGNVIDPKISNDGGKKLTQDEQLEDAGFALAGIKPHPRR